MNDIASAVVKLNQELDTKRDVLLKTQINILSKNNALFGVDLLCMALVNMSFSNIAAFITLTQQDNHLCAMAVIRMHLDGLLKLFSCFIVDKPHDLAKEIVFSETPLSKKAILMLNGLKEKLTDSFLCEQLEKHEKVDWIKRVYQRTSKFVHPSNFHFNSVFNKIDDEDDENLDVTMNINSYGKIDVKNETIEENYDCMIHITDLIIKYLNGWCITKNMNLDDWEKLRKDSLNKEAKNCVEGQPRNSLCKCGSGKKYKRCCGK